MNELPHTSGGTSVPVGGAVNNSEKDSSVHFKDRKVQCSPPSEPQSASEASVSRPPSSGETERKLGERHAGHPGSDDGDGFDELETVSQVSGSDISDLSQITVPHDAFPVPVASENGGSAITTGNTNANSEVSLTGNESITIEGVGKVNKNKFLSAVKAAFNWLKGLFDNKIVVGLVLFLALSLVFGLLASPAGAPFIYAVMAGLSMAMACGFMGLLVADLALRLVQPGPQPNARPTPPPPNSQSNNAPHGTGSTNGNPDPNRSPESTRTEPADGSFYLTPKEKTVSVSATTRGNAEPSVQNYKAPPSSGVTEGGRYEDQSSPEAIFDEWLNKNILRFVNEAKFPGFAKTRRGHDAVDQPKSEAELDDVLAGLNKLGSDLSALVHEPGAESDKSGFHQEHRLKAFREEMEEALELLAPTPEYRREMYNALLQLLPSSQHHLPPNIYAPLLSVGESRQSLAGLPKKELAKIEIYDMLRVTLQLLAGNGKDGEERAESGKREKSFQPPVERKSGADPDSGGSSQDGRGFISTPAFGPIEEEPDPDEKSASVPLADEGVQVILSQKELENNAANRARVVRQWRPEVNGLGIQWEPNDESKSGQVWFAKFKIELRECVEKLTWSNTEPFDSANATAMEQLFMESTGRSIPPTDLDKAYFKFAVEQAALALKDKVEKTITEVAIQGMKSDSSKNKEALFDQKVAFIDAMLDGSRVGSEKTIEDAFQVVSATDQDKLLIKRYIRESLIKNWNPKF